MVRDANQILVDLIVHLLEIEHDQIGHFKQFINNWIVTAHKAVGVEAGMNAFFVAGAEPVAHKFSLKNGFTAGCRHATAGRVHKVAIGHHLFHQIFYGDFFTAMGVPVSRLWQYRQRIRQPRKKVIKRIPGPSTVPQDSKE